MLRLPLGRLFVGILCLISGCNRQIHIQGQVWAPSISGELSRLGDFRAHYQFTYGREFETGQKPDIDRWITTNLEGEFDETIVIPPSDDAEVRVKIGNTRLSTLMDPYEVEWSLGRPLPQVDAEVVNEAMRFVRRDRFELAQPIMQVALSVTVLQNGATSSEEISKDKVGDTLAREFIVWQQCGIVLRYEKYDTVDAVTTMLPFRPADNADLDILRESANKRNPTTLNLVVSASWNSTSSLGSQLAYTNFPSESPLGIVAGKGNYALSNLIAHELGHYFNLLHVDRPDDDGVNDTTSETVGAGCSAPSTANLMFSRICLQNQILTSGQCQRARAAINGFLSSARR